MAGIGQIAVGRVGTAHRQALGIAAPDLGSDELSMLL
jgi:hypothetical protein